MSRTAVPNVSVRMEIHTKKKTTNVGNSRDKIYKNVIHIWIYAHFFVNYFEEIKKSTKHIKQHKLKKHQQIPIFFKQNHIFKKK